jgi:hypothetical protein
MINSSTLTKNSSHKESDSQNDLQRKSDEHAIMPATSDGPDRNFQHDLDEQPVVMATSTKKSKNYRKQKTDGNLLVAAVASSPKKANNSDMPVVAHESTQNKKRAKGSRKQKLPCNKDVSVSPTESSACAHDAAALAQDTPPVKCEYGSDLAATASDAPEQTHCASQDVSQTKSNNNADAPDVAPVASKVSPAGNPDGSDVPVILPDADISQTRTKSNADGLELTPAESDVPVVVPDTPSRSKTTKTTSVRFTCSEGTEEDLEEKRFRNWDSVKMGRSRTVVQKALAVGRRSGKALFYRRGTVVLEHLQEQKGELNARERALKKAMEKGYVDSSTVAADLAAGLSPFAVDQLSVEVLIEFRKKVFALLVIQNVLVLALAIIFDLILGLVKVSSGITFLAWILAVIVLAVLSRYRKKAPCNFRLLVLFDLVGPFALASLRMMFDDLEVGGKSPHLVMFGIHTFGILLLGLIACVGKEKTLKNIVVAPFVILLTTAMFVLSCWFLQVASFGTAFVLLFFNGFALMWIGYQLDKLSSMLQVDEYLLPVVIVWCELLMAIALFLLVASFVLLGCCAGGGCDCHCCDACGNCYCPGGYMCHSCCHGCDALFIHDDERERRNRQLAAEDGGSTAPAQEVMDAPV